MSSMLQSSTESDEDKGKPQDVERKSLLKKSGQPQDVECKSLLKKSGRPIGATQKNYSTSEIMTAFDVLLEQCPRSVSSNKCLKKMQKVSADRPNPEPKLLNHFQSVKETYITSSNANVLFQKMKDATQVEGTV